MTEEYVELHCHSYFSLLDGASSPEALVMRAKALGLSALALTDHDSLAGAVRFWTAAKQAGVHPIVGAELTLADGCHLTLLAENQRGYASLCRLITAAHLHDTPADPSTALHPRPAYGGRAPRAAGTWASLTQWPGKGEPVLSWDWLDAHHEGLMALSGCRRGPVAAPLLSRQPEQARTMAARLCDIFGSEQVWLELQNHQLPDDARLVRELLGLAHALNLPCVATNNVHYATPRESRLRDALMAVHHQQSLAEAQRAGLLPYNHSYGLASADEMMRRFAEVPQALRSTVEIARRCQRSPVSLDFSQQRLPPFITPAQGDEFAHLYQLCHEGLPRRYPKLTPVVLKQLAHELAVIEPAGLAGYFLMVWDIIRFARERGIRCQGRGSAANSLVAYLLNITSVDPLQHNLLFERFLSADRYTIPDIDIDFAADRREEVIQYVYERYGHAHAAMVCNVVTYQARSAVRDLGKALGFPLPVVDRLAKALDTHSPREAANQFLQTIDANAPANHPIRLLADLLNQVEGCPRHLSIHVGGMLITAVPLDELVPLERATLPGRVVCQWDKDSIEDAGLIKIDLLALRTLGLISEALGYIDDTTADGGSPPSIDLDARPLDDPAIYAMLQRADTIGAFQVESRAQQQMLPRLKPTCFDDIAIEIAIVRPGPIQGGAVHPYLRRRAGEEPITYLHPCLEPVLRETLGVLLFQEQAIRVAMVAANFSPSEADMLRRAMSRGQPPPSLPPPSLGQEFNSCPNEGAKEMGWGLLRERFVQGAQDNGIERETAEAIFHQLEGFAGYGFCKSHAASFALIAYQTMYLKRYHAPAFYCALLNQQPMGFYSPEVIVGDARRHGIALLPPSVNHSLWHYTLEDSQRGKPSQRNGHRVGLRMGLQTVAGIGEQGWVRIKAARADNLFTDLPDFCRRTRLPQTLVSDLIRAGALDELGARRQLLWQLGAIDYRPDELPLILPEIPVELPELEAAEQTRWEYELLGLSANGQLMRHYRTALQRVGTLSSTQVKRQANGRKVRVGGMAVVKQSPPTAKGMVFISLEDEFGMMDLIVRPDVFERFRPLLRHQAFILVEGIVQQAGGAVSVLVTRAIEFPSLVAKIA